MAAIPSIAVATLALTALVASGCATAPRLGFPGSLSLPVPVTPVFDFSPERPSIEVQLLYEDAEDWRSVNEAYIQSVLARVDKTGLGEAVRQSFQEELGTRSSIFDTGEQEVLDASPLRQSDPASPSGARYELGSLADRIQGDRILLLSVRRYGYLVRTNFDSAIMVFRLSLIDKATGTALWEADYHDFIGVAEIDPLSPVNVKDIDKAFRRLGAEMLGGLFKRLGG